MFDIVGMGNAIVDLTTLAAENQAFANMHISDRGGFFRTRIDEFEEILHFSKNNQVSAGGSVANSMKAFAALGGKACFIGKIGMDKYGTFFTESLKNYNIYPGLFIDKENATGSSVVLVHKDGEKSICAKLRASKIIPFNSVNMELVAESRMLFMEGYWLDNNLLTVKKIINAARKNLIRIAFTLSDPQIVVQQFDFFAKYMKHIDILLGNEKEFEALGESVLPPVAVKTLGANGVDVRSQGKWQHFQPLKVENVVNTTGAGDAFAGGFLYAVSRGMPIEKAVEIGQLCAVDVLTQAGSHVRPDLNERLR